MEYCSNCGNKLENGVKFCPKCGNPIDGSSQGQQLAKPISNYENNDGINELKSRTIQQVEMSY